VTLRRGSIGSYVVEGLGWSFGMRVLGDATVYIGLADALKMRGGGVPVVHWVTFAIGP